MLLNIHTITKHTHDTAPRTNAHSPSACLEKQIHIIPGLYTETLSIYIIHTVSGIDPLEINITNVSSCSDYN